MPGAAEFLARGLRLAHTEAMIRITVVRRQDSKIRVVVEGRITKDSSAELAGACLEHLTAGDHLALDLSGVTFADGKGVSLVRDLVERGCMLEECSELVRALVGNQSPQSLESVGAGKQNELEILA
jgi:hypothetical protein